MKLFSSILLLLAINCISNGQVVQLNDTQNEQVKERLIELALKRVPALQIAKLEADISKKEQKVTKLEWLSNVKLSANFNEYNSGIKDFDNNGRNLIMPNYNFSVGFSLGEVIGNVYKNKMAKSQVVVAQLKTEAVQTDVKVQVLSLYEEYLLAKEVLGIQTLITDDFQLRSTVQENKYKNGEITIQEYKESFLEFNQSKMVKAGALASLRKAKIAIEAFVGVSIDELENSY